MKLCKANYEETKMENISCRSWNEFNKWKQNGGCADNYNLIVDMENRIYKFYINPYYGYYRPEDIEVKRKSDILDYMEHLKKNGFEEVEQI